MIEEPSTRVLVQTVSQRTITTDNLRQSLTVATIPWEDLRKRSSDSGASLTLDEVASELFGVPRPRILDDRRYGQAVRLIRSLKIWEDIQQDYLDLYYRRLGITREDELAQHAYQELRGRFERFAPLIKLTEEELGEELSREPAELVGGPEDTLHGEAQHASQSLAEHAAIFMLEPEDAAQIAQVTLFPNNVPISYLLSRSDNGTTIRTLERHGLTLDAFLLALRIYSTGINPSLAIANALREIDDYQIPLGHSPQLFKRTIGELFRGGWRSLIIVDELESRLATHRPMRPSIKALSFAEDNLIIQTTDPTVGDYAVQEAKKMPR